ncbi:MAG: hypothetical protein JWO42_1126, partial [Chloroflexi bacterium]|nr:hypothetical protein [Chloroflexota bacterium]
MRSRALHSVAPLAEQPAKPVSREPIALPVGKVDRDARSTIGDYVSLVKPRIMVLLLITTLA